MSGEKRPIDLIYERDRMFALVEELSDEFHGHTTLLESLGIEAVYEDAWFEFRKDGRLFMVEAGPDLTVLVNGAPERPRNLFFDGDYFESLKRRVIAWANETGKNNNA